MSWKFLPYKHPLLGWYFDWGIIRMIDGAIYVGPFAAKWQPRQEWRSRPERITGRRYTDGDVEPDMWMWLRFNISFAGGWGIGLVYPPRSIRRRPNTH